MTTQFRLQLYRAANDPQIEPQRIQRMAKTVEFGDSGMSWTVE